ncbi:Zinc finger, CCHC-type [Sesbania bispinosa]|nr:Zinc finger, CCHC-type [Sesbania bispinosa]
MGIALRLWFLGNKCCDVMSINDASIAAIEGLINALNQQTTVLSTLLGEGGSTLPSGQAAPVTPRPDHQADGFLAFWECHPPIFEGGGEVEFWWRGIRDRVTALDTPITWEAFRTPFLERYSPILQGRRRDLSPLGGCSGGSVMDERVAQQLGRQVAACAKCGKGHRGTCYLGLGRCFYCHQPGHIATDCPRRRNKKAEVQISTFQGDGRS